eukprot:708244-Amphidinium_carterae.1
MVLSKGCRVSLWCALCLEEFACAQPYVGLKHKFRPAEGVSTSGGSPPSTVTVPRRSARCITESPGFIS